jgi:allantoinase
MPRLQQHDRFDYLPMPGRAHYLWPGGTRFAVYVAINLEAFVSARALAPS